MTLSENKNLNKSSSSFSGLSGGACSHPNVTYSGNGVALSRAEVQRELFECLSRVYSTGRVSLMYSRWRDYKEEGFKNLGVRASGTSLIQTSLLGLKIKIRTCLEVSGNIIRGVIIVRAS